MATFTIYDLSTGHFGNVVEASDVSAAAGLAPEGFGIVSGAFDKAVQRLARVVVDGFGDEVAVTESCTLARPPFFVQQNAATRLAMDRLQAIDVALVRPQGELLDALVRGISVPSTAASRHTALIAEKERIRAAVGAIAVATDQQALDEALASLDLSLEQ